MCNNTDPALLIELWVVGNVTDAVSNGWDFIGVFDDESLALDACEDPMYFVGPVRLNEPFVCKDHTDWKGAYFPLDLANEK